MGEIWILCKEFDLILILEGARVDIAIFNKHNRLEITDITN